MVTSQVAALDKVIGHLELGPEFGALVAYCRGLAEVIDEFPGRATLWREYRPAIELLLHVGQSGEDDGGAFLLQLVSTPMGEQKNTG